MKIYFLLVNLLFSAFTFGQSNPIFVLVSQTQQAVIVLPATEPESVQIAVKDLVSDVQKITGKRLEIVAKKTPKQQAIFIKT